MKILIVNTSDINGGAAKAAYRLHKSLIQANIDSQMLVQIKTSSDFTVIEVGNKIEKIIRKIRPFIDNLPLKFYKNRSKTLFSPAWIGSKSIIRKINEIKPDIVHLHWINKGMIKIEDLAKIDAPIVWSLHDMWPFTGGCHYDEGCGKYQQHCGNSKILRSNKENDLSRKIFNRKQKNFNKINNLTIVGLSRWINNCSQNSTLLKNKKHINLPNPIDTSKFHPINKKIAKNILNLPLNKKLILFGAMEATSDIRKGYKELHKALSSINDKNIEIVIFGSDKPKETSDLKFNINYMGYLNDDISLNILYNACDVVIVPSLQENLSNTIMESLSCATPIVAFDIGGNSDMIEHKKNGYLAKPYDSNDLALGIKYILYNTHYDNLCKNARKKVLSSFESSIIANKYLKLYKAILDENQTS